MTKRWTQWLVVAAIAVRLAMPEVAQAQTATSGNSEKAGVIKTIVVVDPKDVAPMAAPDGKVDPDSPSVHRRVISRPKDGSSHLDVGLNTFKAGVGTQKPYAYDKDELCYIVKGVIEAESDGVTVLFKAGNFMWRPAGAATQRTNVTEDTIDICAFGPARIDNWSHKLADSEVGKWHGDETKKPHVHAYDYRYIRPEPMHGAPGSNDVGAAHRQIVSAVKDGAVNIDASYDTYEAGFEFAPTAYENDEICWLESGEIEMSVGSKKISVRANEFVYRPATVAVGAAKVVKDAVSICFFGPARP
jgi:mannose-6-phosphate isomerase-like protein (cupin superfamily)